MTDLREVVARAIDENSVKLDSHGRACLAKATDVADAVLSAIRESIGEDVVEAAVDAVSGEMSCDLTEVRAVLRISTPIIALAARDAALEEAAKAAEFELCEDGDCELCRGKVVAAGRIRALKGGRDHG